MKNIFKLISEGSSNNPVMAPWKEVIKGSDIQKISSYIVSLNGSNPDGGKAAEGEIWVEEEKIPTTETVVDTLTIK